MESRIEHIVEELRSERTTTISRLQQLENALASMEPLVGGSPASPPVGDKPKRRISAQGLANIRAATARRWAKERKRPKWAKNTDARVNKKYQKSQSKAKRYNGTHWMQRPENAGRVKRAIANMQRKRREREARMRK